MSGGFLVAVPRQGPPTAAGVQAALDASAPRGVHGHRHVLTPSGVLLVQCHFEVVPELVGVRGVVHHADAGVWVVTRGALGDLDEHRTTLRRELGRAVRMDHDGEVVLAAYLAWGDRMAGRLDGELSYVVWDERRRRLLAATDHFGRRPCLWHDGPRWLAAATEPAQILCLPGVPDRLDTTAVADYLHDGPLLGDRTFSEGIRRLPPGSSLVAGPDTGVEVRTYWRPVRRWRADAPPQEFAPEVRAAFERSLVARSRSAATVAATLSGGLDSSAVVGTYRQLAERGQQLPELVTTTFRYPGLACDEGPFVEAVRRRWPGPHLEVAETDEPVPDAGRAVSASARYPATEVVTGARLAMLDAVRSVDARVWLGGDGGDAQFVARFPDSLRGRRPDRLARDLWWLGGRSWRPALRVGRSRALAHLPVPAKDLARRVLGRPARPASPLAPSILALAGRARAGVVPVVEDWQFGLFGPPLAEGNVAADCFLVRHGIESREPFLDRRLVELLAEVPPSAHCWGGGVRTLQKQVFADVYPGEVAARDDKAEFSEPLAAYARALVAAAGATPSAVAHGWVEAGALGEDLGITLRVFRLEPALVTDRARWYRRDAVGERPGERRMLRAEGGR